jgi:hypothetical protein
MVKAPGEKIGDKPHPLVLLVLLILLVSMICMAMSKNGVPIPGIGIMTTHLQIIRCGGSRGMNKNGYFGVALGMRGLRNVVPAIALVLIRMAVSMTLAFGWSVLSD